jgi:hypothetical protein
MISGKVTNKRKIKESVKKEERETKTELPIIETNQRGR